ncbi:hypothetical protein EYS09_27255 [Streptomyces kasugaensis]|uniref:Uncharacterized protein n=1 Tax=Streptomyces kasugaensis TaxID=1946 RepID=A0A4Q9HNY4_STRKA|nr:hypothetical protein EYS09_27255 [Streptomyces kasugaensis]
MEFGAAFPADGQSIELVEQGEGLLDDVPERAESFDVRGALAGDDRQDPALAKLEFSRCEPLTSRESGHHISCPGLCA